MSAYSNIKIFIFKALFFISVLFIVFPAGCAKLRQSTDNASIKIKAEKEKLVARDVKDSLWCGEGGALVYVKDNDRVFWYEIETGRNLLVSDGEILPISCTPDGRWLVYLDKGSRRWYEDDRQIPVFDLRRYEIATGVQQKISAVYEPVISFDGGLVSPDGSKIFLGKRTAGVEKMPEPVWDVVWSDAGSPAGAAWFSDSSAVVTSYWADGEPNGNLAVEVVSPKRNTVVFHPGDFGEFKILFTDRLNRVYLRVWDGEVRERIVRCSLDIDRPDMTCRPVLGDSLDIIGFDKFTGGGTFVFTAEGGMCVRVIYAGRNKTDCLTPLLDNLGYFGFGPVMDISPDDKWLAFQAYRRETDYSHTDLFVVKLIHK